MPRHHVAALWLFGSALRPDFRPDGDVDVLVDFEPGARVGLFALAHLQRERSDIFGRPVDLVPLRGLKPAVVAGIFTIMFGARALKRSACRSRAS